ncbi:MAG: DUF2703 domain-containing protein [Anaerolineae bacterium]|nr:DUF2703 domain-containing protein [Anaerolineae bacterium]
MSITIDFLYWPECPSHPDAWERLQKVLAETGVEAQVNTCVIETEAEAEAADFLGSPTIRVNGRDVDPQTPAGAPARLTCRLYFREDGRPSAIPTEAMIRNALSDVQTLKEK